MKLSQITAKINRYARCYDNGEVGDRYTVCYGGRYRHKTGGASWYVGMSAEPFHPQGIGQHGESPKSVDANKWGFYPMIGRKNHLGTRIRFDQLPDDCQKLVMTDLKSLFDIK